MNNNIKAIETCYNGFRFRSRLEARWAVFFDSLGVKYEYEFEGFELGDGTRYLPDFLVHGSRDFYCEIKPSQPSVTEMKKAELLAYGTGIPVDIVMGLPGDNRITAYYGRKPPINLHLFAEMALDVKDFQTFFILLNRNFYWGDLIDEVRAKYPEQLERLWCHPNSLLYAQARIGNHDIFDVCPNGHLLVRSVMEDVDEHDNYKLRGCRFPCICGQCGHFTENYVTITEMGKFSMQDTMNIRTRAALTAAKAARFEFGETPDPQQLLRENEAASEKGYYAYER